MFDNTGLSAFTYQIYLHRHNRIIVIGASAGGLRALLRVVPGLARDLPAPLLIVLHIGKHPSHVAELLGSGGFPVEAAQTGVQPQPGHIYVAAPDQHLLLEDGVLRLFRGPKEHHARPAINPLFRSAALEYGPGAIGVILTGMLDDGSAGLHAIKVCGGTAIVQDPDDAAYPSMPRAAIASTTVDHVVSIDALAALLNTVSLPLADPKPVRPPEWLLTEHAISLGRAGMKEIGSIGMPAGYSCPDCGGSLFEVTQARPLRFLCHTGHAYSLRTLAMTQKEAADQALWAGLRALEEKAAILHRLTQLKATDEPGSETAVAAEVRQLERYIERMRELVTSAPADGDVAAAVE